MSTSAQISPAWKVEVNRRLAEHRSRDGSGRKSTSATEPQAPVEAQRNASRRAMEAAARVAARYANAPSYSEVLANEARAALRAAEAASRAALQAQAAAQSVLAGIEAANAAEAEVDPVIAPVVVPVDWRMKQADAPVEDFPPGDCFGNPLELRSEPDPEFDQEPGPELVRSELPAAYAPIAAALDAPAPLRWDLELPAHPPAPVETRAARGQEFFETGAESWWRPAVAEPDRAEVEPIELVEPMPIPANLIEFPRELVAPRKARPRLVEGPSAAQEIGAQLSIFEVDPNSISTEPMAAESAPPAQAWAMPTWSGMELEAQPAEQDAATHEVHETLSKPASRASTAAAPQDATALDTATAPEADTVLHAATAVEPAPVNLRLMAVVVDGTLIAGSLLAAVTVAASKASALPGLRATEIGMALAFVAAAILYQLLFFTLGSATPGMKYARLRLTNFEGLMPLRAERYKRMAALLVSVLPVGLGLAWSLFDDDHLSWHDRLSRTYLCKQ